MSRYVNSYQELVELEEKRLDVLLENTTIDNLFSNYEYIRRTEGYLDHLYRYYYKKTRTDVHQYGQYILIVPKKGYITQRIIYLNPNLLGGTIAGTQAINITQQDGAIRLQDKGAVNSTKLIYFLRSLFYAFGIEVDESKIDLISLCNSVLSDFEFIYNKETGKSIIIDSVVFNAIEIMYILEKGITYFDEDLVQAFANKMYEVGWFNFDYGLINNMIPNGETGIVELVPFSKELLNNALKGIDRPSTSYPIATDCIDLILSDIVEKYNSRYGNTYTGTTDILNDFEGVAFELDYGSSPTYGQVFQCRIFFYSLSPNEALATSDVMYYEGNEYQTVNINDGYNKAREERLQLNKIPALNYFSQFRIFGGDVVLATSSVSDNIVINDWINGVGLRYNKYTYSPMNGTFTKKSVDGISVIDGAKLPTNIDSLASDYPTWYEKLSSWVGTGISKVGETLRNTLNVIDFVPLTLIANSPEQAQSGEVIDPDIVGNVPEVVIKDLDPFPTSDTPSEEPYDPNVPELTPSLPPPLPTPTPPVPPIDPTPSITSGKLFTVYNPTTDDINALGGFLWGESIAGILAELFSNPMDAIISLNVIYATPSIGARRNIVLGYVKSDDITAPIVTSQYITLDCGTVRVPEYYGNATDYAPFSCASIYLPFIGFRDVNINEIMGSEVNINYKIDVYTGTVYASVSTIRNGIMQVLYTYEGNCAVQIPLTGGDRSRLLGGVVGAVAGLAMGSPITAIGSVASGIFNGATSNKQGSIGANAGAMGIKNPYIVITNTQAYDAYNYNKQYGFPANASIQLGSCKGYTRVKSVHVSSISNATNEEKQTIDSLLKQGVIIN